MPRRLMHRPRYALPIKLITPQFEFAFAQFFMALSRT